ncbi:hypothetical protein SM39_4507 [Serratia marcescens SM39]|uniref:Uncharacterized protein n=1 Tax=Serratia marcescens SM39 TaxID=1334564 RepID=A0AAT9F4P4_SERMA|nr:hypothetical protein SM39_4507 [Serratia marcescens SM39]
MTNLRECTGRAMSARMNATGSDPFAPEQAAGTSDGEVLAVWMPAGSSLGKSGCEWIAPWTIFLSG